MALSTHLANTEAEAAQVVADCRKRSTVNLLGVLCIVCHQTFNNKREYDAHYLSHNLGSSEIKYKCVVCHKVITGYSTFRGHCYNLHAHKFKCNFCEKSFTKQSALNCHINAIHIFKCKQPQCNKQFPTKKELHHHQVVHTSKANKPPYPCVTCGTQIDGMEMCEHHIDEHCVYSYTCPICNEDISKETAVKHLSIHFDSNSVLNENEPDDLELELKNERSDSLGISDNSSINIVGGIQCYLCQDISKNKSEFELHFTTEHPDCKIMYSCIICKKQYEKYPLFGSHTYDHFTKNKFECEFCPRFFPRLARLAEHVAAFHPAGLGAGRDAPGPRPLACPHCPKAFATERHRRAHLQTTHQQDGLPCPRQGCGAVLSTPKELLLHSQSHDPTAGTWCRRCGLSFASAAAAARHADLHRGKRYHCPVCGGVFPERYQVMKHVVQHFETMFHMCKTCAKVFSHRYRLLDHVKTHSALKSYECPHCHKAFTKTNHLQQHLVLHTGDKPYKCAPCGKAFSNYPNYNKHLRRVHNADAKQLKKAVVDKQLANAAKTNAEMHRTDNVAKENDNNNRVIANGYDLIDSMDTDDSTMGSEGIDPAVIGPESSLLRADLPLVTLGKDCVAEIIAQAENLTPLVPVLAPEPPMPREYGPDFAGPAAADDHLLPHIDPLLTIKPAAPLYAAFDYPYETALGLDAPPESAKYESPFPKIFRCLEELDSLNGLGVDADIYY